MSAFTSVKVFSASMYERRQTLGDEVTRWLEEARRTRSGFQIVDIVIRQSSDREYHALSIVVFFRESPLKRSPYR
jgi:hypothetical protein